ncbi:MAG TPA: pyruvate kinase [Terrimicrobiaceae bacterium]
MLNGRMRRTKIVATLGPASNSREVIRQLVQAGMDVARLNFSHGSYEQHAQTIINLREISEELDTPVTILQDLQGPKIRVGKLPGDEMVLNQGEIVTMVPEHDFTAQPNVIPLDYPHAAEEAKGGMRVLLDDGMMQLEVLEAGDKTLRCRVVDGGKLKNRKGVNFPDLNLRQLPSLTEKDKEDLKFGISQDVDWISLSFVRSGEDVRSLKELIAKEGVFKPVIAKIEKPQAIENLDAILEETNGVMVARGDLGVELSPEKVPMLQKRIIESCNRRGIPVITATQMLESMIRDPRPTRAEASDVANAIIDGTDAVMLSGESAVGAFPVRAVEMMGRIAREVESSISFKTYSAQGRGVAYALSEAAKTIARTIEPSCIVVLTTTGRTAHWIAAERPKTSVVAIARRKQVYHALNLFWGLKPLLVSTSPTDFEGLVKQAESTLLARGLAAVGDKILVIGGVPAPSPHGANFLKVHTVGAEGEQTENSA